MSRHDYSILGLRLPRAVRLPEEDLRREGDGDMKTVILWAVIVVDIYFLLTSAFEKSNNHPPLPLYSFHLR